MAAPQFDQAQPTFGSNPVDTALTALRNNMTFLLAVAAGNNYLLPGWSSTPSGADLDKPDYVEMINNGAALWKMKFTFTYTGDNVTTILYQYDAGGGSGYETLTTVTHAYNGSDQWTGSTTV